MINIGRLTAIALIAMLDFLAGHWIGLVVLYPVVILADLQLGSWKRPEWIDSVAGPPRWLVAVAAIAVNAAVALLSSPLTVPLAAELLVFSAVIVGCVWLAARNSPVPEVGQDDEESTCDLTTLDDGATLKREFTGDQDDADTAGIDGPGAKSFFQSHFALAEFSAPLPLSKLLEQIEKTSIVPIELVRELVDGAKARQSSESITAYLLRKRAITLYQRRLMLDGNTEALEIGDYWIVDRIGQGAEGVVLRARHKRSGLDYAIKMIESGDDNGRLQRIRREMEATKGLVHPNVIVAAETGESRGVCYIVMEWIEGTTLETLVAEHGPLSVQETLDIVLQAARGLRCTHEHGVVHRDVKPGNLMLDQRGKVRVLDLGLARTVVSECDEVGSKHGGIFGTIDYMAPEQARDFGGTDSRADIYSLGCTMFFLLTGMPRLRGPSEQSRILNLLRRRGLRDVRKYLTHFPQCVADLVAQMAAPKAKDRPDTMEEIEQMLIALASELDIELKDNTEMRILLVEDNEQHRDNVIEKMSFSHHPHVIQCASTLSDAIEMARRQQFDVGLVNMFLPDSDGEETIARLRSANNSLPIVALTSRDDNELGVRCIHAGADDYIPKSQISEGVVERRLLLSLNRR